MKRILVVDDKATIRELIRTVLENTAFTRGTAAVESLDICAP